MSTPVPAARSKGGIKRFCPANSPSSPSIDPVRLTDSLKEVNESAAVPACVKNAFNSLVVELTSLKRERDKLLEENQILRSRLGLRPGSSVHDTVADVPDDGQGSRSIRTTAVQPTDERDLKRLQSIVINGIPELDSTDIESRVRYDFLSVRNILFHIGVECLPVTVYRLDRPIIGRSRLLKVVLPSSRFQCLADRLAPRLRSFPERGVHIRESLSQEERMRRCEAYRSSIANSSQNVMHNTNSVHGN
ncbi:unnamed protein product [Heligmosomoides polygyrus]|uniref:TSC-22/dip/bun family protein n=1 Tax=Heligmosomoides polygyrus TaxID=6339 RepID=A0A183GCI4_HELPZ|nr:unnamed protein product [Heligmosomoides polygyrus]